MAIKVLVSSFTRDLWIAAFIPILAWFLFRLCEGALEGFWKSNTRRQETGTTAITPPTGATTFEPVTAVPLTTTVDNNTVRGRKPFGVQAFREASHVLLVGFILLISMAAMSGAMGYYSRSLMALSNFTPVCCRIFANKSLL